MKKRIIAIALVSTLLLAVLCACGSKNKVISTDEALSLAAEYLQIDVNDISEPYIHIVEGENPGYSLHFTCDGKSYSVIVDVVTGEISESDH